MLGFTTNLKLGVARVLSKLFYWVYDPQVESKLGDRRDYEFFQNQRRKKIETYLSRYLGPKL